MSFPSGRIQEASRRIGGVFYEWLEAEVASSSAEGDVNTYLNDFYTVRKGLAGGWDDVNNFPARKLESHNNRLSIWYQDYLEYPGEDLIAAKLPFAGLMQASGAYRDQCYIEATDGEDYMRKRHGVIGIDLVPSVNDRLRAILPRNGNFARADISIEDFERQMKGVIKVGELAVKKMSGRARAGFDLAIPDTPSVRTLKDAQYEWLTLTTDAVALVAKMRGGKLEDVPFLEPISISSQSGAEPHYPFRPNFPGWSEVMAA